MFTFTKITTATCAIIIASSIQLSSVFANNFGITDTRVLMGDQACRNGYGVMRFTELDGGGCFQPHTPYGICMTGIKVWTELQKLTNRDCLNILRDIANNQAEPDAQWNDTTRFRQVQQNIARSLIKNSLFMNTLDGLDQAALHQSASE